jgi:hypothetical protein
MNPPTASFKEKILTLERKLSLIYRKVWRAGVTWALENDETTAEDERDAVDDAAAG